LKRRGDAARREPDRAEPQEKRRRGGVGPQNDFVDQHHPSRRYRVGFPLLG
jgi:hypothetical protein